MSILQKLIRWGHEKSAVETSSTKDNSEIVVFEPTHFVEGVLTYSEFYSVHICPKCHVVLDDRKARYYSKCCYKCGYSNCKVLFDPEKVTVRDVYINGKFAETVVHERR